MPYLKQGLGDVDDSRVVEVEPLEFRELGQEMLQTFQGHPVAREGQAHKGGHRLKGFLVTSDSDNRCAHPVTRAKKAPFVGLKPMRRGWQSLHITCDAHYS